MVPHLKIIKRLERQGYLKDIECFPNGFGLCELKFTMNNHFYVGDMWSFLKTYAHLVLRKGEICRTR